MSEMRKVVQLRLQDTLVDLVVIKFRSKDEQRWTTKFTDPSMLERSFKFNSESLRSFFGDQIVMIILTLHHLDIVWLTQNLDLMLFL